MTFIVIIIDTDRYENVNLDRWSRWKHNLLDRGTNLSFLRIPFCSWNVLLLLSPLETNFWNKSSWIKLSFLVSKRLWSRSIKEAYCYMFENSVALEYMHSHSCLNRANNLFFTVSPDEQDLSLCSICIHSQTRIWQQLVSTETYENLLTGDCHLFF